jgi:hypothetical protein
VHALFDGVAIGSGFALSNWLGWLIFLAILLHKAPEGFTMASVMMASGRSRRTAFWSAVALAGATLVGVLVIQLVPRWVPFGLPVSAGVALYVAATDLGARGEPGTGHSHGAGVLCRRGRVPAAAHAAAADVDRPDVSSLSEWPRRRYAIRCGVLRSTCSGRGRKLTAGAQAHSFRVSGITDFCGFGFLVMGYHPGLEDDGIYLAAVKADLNPALFPYNAKFFRLQMEATIFDGSMAHFVRWTRIPLAWAELVWQLAALFLILWAVKKIANRLFKKSRAMGRSRAGRGHVHAACDRNRALHGRPASAPAHAGDGDDSAGYLAHPG